MKFCANCDRVMRRDASTGVVKFVCICGNSEPGTPADARIAGAVLGAGETTEMYGRLIQNAPFDRTNQIVRRPCGECGLDYQVQIRVGKDEVIIYRCKCGAGGRAAAPAAPAGAAPAATAVKE